MLLILVKTCLPSSGLTFGVKKKLLFIWGFLACRATDCGSGLITPLSFNTFKFWIDAVSMDLGEASVVGRVTKTSDFSVSS